MVKVNDDGSWDVRLGNVYMIKFPCSDTAFKARLMTIKARFEGGNDIKYSYDFTLGLSSERGVSADMVTELPKEKEFIGDLSIVQEWLGEEEIRLKAKDKRDFNNKLRHEIIKRLSSCDEEDLWHNRDSSFYIREIKE